MPTTCQSCHCLENLAGFKTMQYDCCPNNCMCYTGAYAVLDRCIHCFEPWLNEKGSPGRHSTILLLFLTFQKKTRKQAMQPMQTKSMQGQCNTTLKNSNTFLVKQVMYLTAQTTISYLKWMWLLIMRNYLTISSLMLETLLLVYQQMVLHHSKGRNKLHGPLFSSITT